MSNKLIILHLPTSTLLLNYKLQCFCFIQKPVCPFLLLYFLLCASHRHDRTRNLQNRAGQSKRFEAMIQPHWKAWVSMCHDLRADRITVWQHPLAESRSSLNSRHSCPVCSNLQLNAEGFFFTPHDCLEHQNDILVDLEGSHSFMSHMREETAPGIKSLSQN